VNRAATADQLSLFDFGTTVRTTAVDEMIEAGIMRHGYDLADHQRGHIVLDWDTAGGGKKGGLIPAWICCVCGRPEPNAYWLTINHYCGTIPGCAARDPNKPWPAWATFRLAVAA
jgi:hypothetical protein